VLIAGSCGGNASETDQAGRWLSVLDAEVAKHPPVDDVMQLDLSAPCDLVDEFNVHSEALVLVGAGVSNYGVNGEGVRYQCAWSGGDDGQPANARLEVIRLTSDHDVEAYRNLLESRDHAQQVVVDGFNIHVAEAVPAPSASRTFDAELVLEDRRAVLRLLVEVTDTELRTQLGHEGVAEILAETLNSSAD
jgi:hypothetical protein